MGNEVKPKKAVEFLMGTHIIWKDSAEKELIVEALNIAYQEGFTSTRVSDSQGEVDLKSPLTAREEELQKLYLASQDNRREERLLHDRALSTLRERMNRITEETETARIQLTKENLMTIILRIARLSRAEKEGEG